MLPKPGAEPQVAAMLEEWERDRKPKIRGAIGGYIFRPDNAPGHLIGVAIFRDRSHRRGAAVFRGRPVHGATRHRAIGQLSLLERHRSAGSANHLPSTWEGELREHHWLIRAWARAVT